MSIKAILFDMDGVLINAKEWHYEALNKALEPFGMAISKEDHLDHFDGLPTLKKLEILTIERGLSTELHGLINKMKQDFTATMIHDLCKPCSIHETALSRLKSMGLKIAVCSNSVRNSVDSMMQKSGLDQYLDLKLSQEDVLKGKPDPEIYTKAMLYFGLKPQECLIIEDNINGIQAAKASGGHLMVVKEVTDTNLDNILSCIEKIESKTIKKDMNYEIIGAPA